VERALQRERRVGCTIFIRGAGAVWLGTETRFLFPVSIQVQEVEPLLLLDWGPKCFS